jgi:hypothetical protein
VFSTSQDRRPILETGSEYKQVDDDEDDSVRTVTGAWNCTDTVVEQIVVGDKPEMLRIFQTSCLGVAV